ncbi:restriction endonuclease [Alkalihalophilus marmarensis]|uniref:restriction endonuclease n=1 Tax=Alkalihalophilus marmarensis TaxID=521377 RepID=UPI002DB98BCE|nr:restriction endonuclease [Alkalihalophilus marmarensis]MEC2073760.1 restriction endonuclease [Alkalihalophilus marmarensis]
MGRRRRRLSHKSTTNYLGVFMLIMTLGLYLLIKILEFLDWLLELSRQLTIPQWFFLVSLLIAAVYTVRKLNENKKRRDLIVKQERLRILKLERKERITRQANIDTLCSMDPYEFEHFVADLYRCQGFEATVTKKSGDGGKDIILKKGEKVALIECKRYNKPKVTRPDVQKFHSALIDAGAEEGFFITTGKFTKPAIEYVKNKSITLITAEELLNIIAKLEKEDFNVLSIIKTPDTV